jgi:hypothetical protein
MLIFSEGEKSENPEKNPRIKGDNQQQTQLTYAMSPGIEPEITLVRGECLASTPLMLPINLLYIYYLRFK